MIFNDLFQELLVLEVKFTHLLQLRISYFERFLSAASAVSDPKNITLYVYPCIAVFFGPYSRFSLNLMLVGSLINWISTELKWLLGGDRPYWWIKEVAKTYPGLPHLHHTHDTCVANPGNPSAHIMLSSGILYVIFNALISLNTNPCMDSSKLQPDTITTAWYSCRRKMGLWTLYIIMLIIVMLSRIYNATHFPHQCILSAVLGGVVANTISANLGTDWQERHKSYRLLFYAAMPTYFAFGSYWLQKGFGIDPQLSVRLAFKWCFSPTDIDVTTTSVYALTNSCGSLLGLAIALIFQRLAVVVIGGYSREKNIYGNGLALQTFVKGKSVLFHIINGVGVFISACLLTELRKNIPPDNVIEFYLYHFFINMAAPVLFLAFVPIFLAALYKKLKIKKD